MAKTEFTTNIINSSEDVPFYKKYPTPIYDKEELHRTVSPILDTKDFNDKHYMTNIAEQIVKDATFDRACKSKTIVYFMNKGRKDV